ncbi:MAG: acyl carrier protein [Spartobacteria bacterium]|nr:acyl carrier protein [Spartobacteria bacterium]
MLHNKFMSQVSVESLREILMQNCMLKIDPSTIGEETPLFGPDGIGLDSLDALQIVLAVEKKYGIVIADPNTAKDALQSLGVLRDWISKRITISPE